MEEQDTEKHCNTIKAVREHADLEIKRVEAAVGLEIKRVETAINLEIKRLEAIIKERDRLYEERFNTQEKALAKAEEAQDKYNDVHNDLTRRMVLRTEYDKDIGALTGRLDLETTNLKERYEESKKEIYGLREYKSEAGGRVLQTTQDQAKQQQTTMATVAVISLVISGVGLLISILVNVVLKIMFGI